MGKQIRAGTVSDIYKQEGEWLFIDLGFAMGERSCGIVQATGQSDAITFCDAVKFGEMVKLVKKQVARQNVRLVLEAPLSVTFNKSGNPTGRACDVKAGEKKARYWHQQSATPMILSAGYLLREIANQRIKHEVRLFEGLVSWKKSKSPHTRDAKVLKNAVWNPNQDEIFDAGKIKRHSTDTLKSAFEVMGMNFGIPPVIRPNHDL